jgi:hypothetical protein
MASEKLTKAQRAFLESHPSDGKLLTKFAAHKTYDFIGRLMRLGLITIEDGGSKSGWPYMWEGTRITEAGREALKDNPHALS